MSVKNRKDFEMNKLDDHLIQQALSPEGYKEYRSLQSKLATNARNIPTLVNADVPIEGWWQELATGVSSRLDAAKKDAAKERRDKDGAEMPWVHRASASTMLKDIERLQWFNQRVLEFSRQMVAKHAILAEGLEWQAAAVKDIIAREEREFGKVFTMFMLRLKRADLKAQSVKDLSNAAIAALARALNREHDVDLLAALGVPSSRYVMSDEEIAELEAEESRILADIERMKSELALAQNAPAPPPEPVLPPPISVQLGQWDYSKGPLPPEWWSSAQQTPPGYSWTYRRATEEELEQTMRLPEAHDWTSLRAWDRLFSEISLERIRTLKGANNNIRDFIGEKLDVSPDDVSDNTVRAWIFLLAGRTMPAPDFERMFDPGYFDGIVIPCVASDIDVVRVLAWKEPDPA